MEGFWLATSQFVSKSEARVGRNGRARGSERDRDIDRESEKGGEGDGDAPLNLWEFPLNRWESS